MLSDIEIARAAKLKPIADIAARIGVPESALYPYGRSIAKLDPEFLESLADRPDGKLILVTAISPTPAGEGKTTTTVGLGDALNRIGRKTIICLREPSLGPCFGMKGGAAGGGYAQVVPMDAINLHFTGDFHAITSAHNLLAAMIDNHLYWGNALGLDPRRIAWRRALDMNDRALRETIIGLGGPGNGFPRQEGFDITVASEVMAAFCLAANLEDLERRLGRMIVGSTRDRRPVTASDLKAEGAMTVLLKDALKPNLVQTLEGSPALVHGGPFANIAHGCNSVVGDPRRPQARRLCRHRGGFRRRPRGGKILRHQVPQGRAPAGGGGDRGDRAGAQDARRRRQGGARRGKPPGATAKASPISRAISPTCASSACRSSSRSIASMRTPRRNSISSRPRSWTSFTSRPSFASTGRAAARDARIWPMRSPRSPTAARPDFVRSIRMR